ncbi:MAG: hypothetical protein QM820_08765 [Minicystis sp.]
MSQVDLLPNNTLIAMVTKDTDNNDVVLAYAFAVPGQPTIGGNEAEQVQRWVLFSRDPRARPPARANVRFKVVPAAGATLPYDFRGATDLRGFIECARAAFVQSPNALLYIKANCQQTKPVKDVATGLYSIPQPYDERRPSFLGPEPKLIDSQADTGTRWLLQVDRIIGNVFTQRVNEARTYEWWMLYDGADTTSATFELEISDLRDNHRDGFLDDVNRRMRENDTLVVAACTSYLEVPAGADA